MPVEFWNKQQVAGAIGTGLYEGAFFDPNGGHIHPMKLVQVWKAAAQSVGAEIYENSGGDAHRGRSQNLVHTINGFSVKAKSLVLATNAFTSRLGYFRNSIVPVHEYVAMTPPLSEQQVAQIGWSRRSPFNDSRTEVIYLGLTRDNRIHIGGGSPSYFFNNGVGDPHEPSRHYAHLHRELVRLYPALEGVEFEAIWSGMVDWSLNESPSVGRTGKYNNIFYGLGYSGHGVNLTSVFGRIIAISKPVAKNHGSRIHF